MKNTIKSFTLIIAFLLTATISMAQGDLISAKDFGKAIKDKNTVVVSTQSSKNYGVSHIKGAIHLDHKKLYKDGKPEGLLKSADDMAKIFAAAGISNTNSIIIYDDAKDKYAGRVYWILKYLGVKDVKILEKDMKAWRSARVPLTKAPAKAKKATFTAAANNDIIVDMAWMKSHLGDASVAIVDVREVTEFKGTSTTPKSPGHIKGAINLNWETLVNAQGVLKDKATIESLFKSAGITADKTIVFYCATSVRAGLPYFVAKTILDYPNVKVYDGAMNEWETEASNPIVK
ncbi:MAG: sulfurtransferase [Bacteroidales bacterium]|nr:sulfurtransferase [Bacteroidales bacterium]